eukprot:jgi/Tetstr1/457676/TSEL_044223.t1
MENEGKNFNHEMENWRQRIDGEVKTARLFEDTWGFLAQGPDLDDPDSNLKSHQMCRVKYFNPHSPSWTVKEKRVPLPYGKTVEMDPSKESHATLRAFDTHSTRMTEVVSSPAQFRQTSRAYGMRKSIETFGVSQYGVKATMSKLFPQD